jgi:hypothetical protein
MVILFYSWLAAKTGTGLIIISVFYGIASGAFVSLQAPMITKLADDMRFAGTMVGQVLSTYRSSCHYTWRYTESYVRYMSPEGGGTDK